jgi:Ca-activated chloride channel family protein
VRLLSPWFALVGLLAIPIIVLYMLKLQRQKVEVSSTLLWQMVLQDRQANRPWQKLKRNLLLIIQLFVLAALVFALIQPAIPGKTISNAQVIVILDATASMQAADVSPSRFEAAKKEIQTIINDLPSNSEMTLIRASAEPVVLLAHSHDKSEMREAVDVATVSYGEANWRAVFALANASISIPDHRVVLLSDGDFPDSDISLYTDRFQYIPIGSRENNLGIDAFSISPAQSGSELFIKVRNYSDSAKSALLSIFQDKELLQAKHIEIPPQENHTEVIKGLSTGIQTYTARLSSDVGDNPLDDYSLDDHAYIAYHPKESKRILLVSKGNFFLEQFLSVLPDTEAYKFFPSEIGPESPLPNEGFSIFMYDGYFPDKLPNGNILLINPPENPLFSVSPATQDYGKVEVLDHLLTQHIEWDQVQIKKTKVIETPVWAEPLVTSEVSPLVFVGEYQSHRFAVLSFDLLDSDLPLHITFPILFNQLLTYLNPPAMYDASDGYKVDQPVQLKPGASVEALHILLPDGTEQDLTLDEYGATFLDTGQPGIYTITALPGNYTEQFAVNAFSDIESGIAPRQEVSIAKHNGSDADKANQQMGLKNLWQVPAMIALVFLMIEWWLYYRRPIPLSVLNKIPSLRQRNTH